MRRSTPYPWRGPSETAFNTIKSSVPCKRSVCLGTVVRSPSMTRRKSRQALQRLSTEKAEEFAATLQERNHRQFFLQARRSPLPYREELDLYRTRQPRGL